MEDELLAELLRRVPAREIQPDSEDEEIRKLFTRPAPMPPEKKWDWLPGFRGVGPLPDVARPSLFQADPTIQGDPEMQKIVMRYLDKYPELKRKITPRGIISHSPPTEYLKKLERDGLNMEDFDKTTTIGQMWHKISGPDKDVRNVYIQRGKNPEQMLDIIVHEFSHVMGQGHEKDKRYPKFAQPPYADVLGKKARQLRYGAPKADLMKGLEQELHDEFKDADWYKKAFK